MISKRQQQRLYILVLFFISNCCKGQEQNCNNSFFASIRTQGILFRRIRTCWWVRRDKSRCDVINLNTKQKVGFTCARECPNVSRCGVNDQDVPTTPSAPTPMSSPIVIVTKPFAPTIPIGTYPPGPYIQVETSSELVKIPRPKEPLMSDALTNCPHDMVGLSNWMVTSTWPGGIVPTPNNDVTLPANTKVLISATLVGVFGYITIPSTSELIIGSSASNVNEIELHTKGMNIFGKLTIGSSTCRIDKFVTITLYGIRPLDAITNVPAPWIKGINVDGGTLSLYGQRYYNTWTRLAKTVLPGETMIFLQEEVNWDIGQQIILVTSAIKDSRDYNRNEVLTIKQIDYNPSSINVGTVILVNEMIQYTHVANDNYQVEVGLLSRNIIIQGNEFDSEPTDKDPGTCTDVDAGSKQSIYYNTTRPCVNNTELTGYGGHIIIKNGGIGQLAGVELYRMGQTNLLGRYPMHYHLLRNDCPTCFVSDSSIHRSFYRCISIHGTNLTTINENVAYDIVGHCYYLESGVEVNNTISYNLAAHIHTLGPQMLRGSGHSAPLMTQNDYNLATPVDVAASGFYILNMYNTIIGNAASGGWAGYAFPLLNTPLDVFRNESIRPSNSMTLVFDGNTGHSTGWWWRQASAFYVGSTLQYNKDTNLLEYDPGRSKTFFRNTCTVNPCFILKKDCGRCTNDNRGWLRFTNIKSFLSAGIGFSSWHGRLELLGYETHDVRLAFQSISTAGMWLDNMLAVCRSGEKLDLPSDNANWLDANGIIWYDINQKHIVTDSTFRNCGYRSDQFNQYDKSPTRGCDSNSTTGCRDSSTTFGFLTSSDIFAPQIMTATRNITFDNCGRRFWFEAANTDTVSGRGQNWIDVDGTISGFKEPTLIGSGVNSVKDWWGVDDEVLYDAQAPLRFIKKNNGPQREMAYTEIMWDMSLHNQSGKTLCTEGIPCPAEGYVRHAGKKFTPSSSVTPGMPLTARSNVNGLSGGFGWIVDFNNTAPRHIDFVDTEIAPNSILLISIPYPNGTTFNVTAEASNCFPVDKKIRCNEIFTKVSTMDEVRKGAGNTYFVDSNGVLTFRLAQIRFSDVGNPNWALPNYTTPSYFSRDVWALLRFERDGVLLPVLHQQTSYQIQAKCPSDDAASSLTGFCSEPVPDYDPEVCQMGYVQVAYDKCCQINDKTKCMFADGSSIGI